MWKLDQSFFPKIYISDDGNIDTLICFCFSYLLADYLYNKPHIFSCKSVGWISNSADLD